MSRSRILFLISGSIAGFKACQVISRLVQQGHEVRVAMTSSAQKFIGPATIEGLTGTAPWTDLWQTGKGMDHIHLTRWADFAILCPASATTLARIRYGLADDLVSALALAWPKDKKFHVFPAMNSQMLINPATQDNLTVLKERGFQVASTDIGGLACGEFGEGRLLEPDQILSTILENRKSKGNILVTLGPTRERIDGIRFLSNVSTGRTGTYLSQRLQSKGWNVLALCGTGCLQPSDITTETFSDFNDLNERLHRHLASGRFQAVIHSAAVSDYSVSEILVQGKQISPRDHKLSSDENLTLQLRRNFKILSRLKEYARNKSLQVIGFKLTLNASEEQAAQAVLRLFESPVDYVVSNDWSQVATDRSRHPGRLWSRSKDSRTFSNLDELCELLDPILGENK